jgi:ASC-1-like (ASCH) protein
MNYGYGINAVTIYTLDPYTSEDAAVVSESLCKRLRSIECDTVKVVLNSNDYFINMYGRETDSDGNMKYKPIPDIGEFTSDRLCATRRQFNNQLLNDFKESALNEIHEGDSVYFVGKNVKIIDITIYDNCDEIVDNPFLEQINKYRRSQYKYWKKVHDMCKEIKESGKDYDQLIERYLTVAQKFIDKDSKWVNSNGGEFSNMEIEITVMKEADATKGSKLTGKQICWCKISLIVWKILKLNVPKCNKR